MLGILLGSVLPDAVNLLVAVATVMKLPTARLYRTFTHSLFMVLAVMVVFTVLMHAMQKGFMTPYGAVYLLSLSLAIGVTIRMCKTVEAAVV
jgi:hypothetical protein